MKIFDGAFGDLDIKPIRQVGALLYFLSFFPPPLVFVMCMYLISLMFVFVRVRSPRELPAPAIAASTWQQPPTVPVRLLDLPSFLPTPIFIIS